MTRQEIEIRIGENLKHLREKKELTQEMLAVKMQVFGCDVTRSSIGKIEVGQRHLHLDEIVAIKRILGVSYEKMFDVSEKPTVEEITETVEASVITEIDIEEKTEDQEKQP